MTANKLLALIALPVLLLSSSTLGRTEEERVAEYHARNHTWPPQFVPDTPGWRKLMEHRLRQVAEIEDRGDRFEGYAQTISAAVVQKNYTEHGFGLARAPQELVEALRKGIREGVEKGPRLEKEINAISGDRPWFVDRPDLTARVLREMHRIPEEWAGLALTANNAYGFRLYRTGNELYTHVE